MIPVDLAALGMIVALVAGLLVGADAVLRAAEEQ